MELTDHRPIVSLKTTDLMQSRFITHYSFVSIPNRYLEIHRIGCVPQTQKSINLLWISNIKCTRPPPHIHSTPYSTNLPSPHTAHCLSHCDVTPPFFHQYVWEPACEQWTQSWTERLPRHPLFDHLQSPGAREFYSNASSLIYNSQPRWQPRVGITHVDNSDGTCTWGCKGHYLDAAAFFYVSSDKGGALVSCVYAIPLEGRCILGPPQCCKHDCLNFVNIQEVPVH